MTIGKKIDISFLEKKEIKENINTIPEVITILPHQRKPLQGEQCKVKKIFHNQKNVEIKCPCKDSSDIYDYFENNIIGDPKKTIWIKTRSLSVKCISSILSNWIDVINKEEIGSNLGIYISEYYPNTTSNKIELWKSTKNGMIKKELKDQDNIVWYLSLNRDPKKLEEINKTFTPIKIFPLTSVSTETVNDDIIGMTDHVKFLNKNKNNMEKVMYINDDSPYETYEYIFNSIHHIPTQPIYAEPIITPPQYNPINCLSMITSAITSETLLFSPPNEKLLNNKGDSYLLLTVES